MNATPEQLSAAGSAARLLLSFAWSRQPRNSMLVINGITAVAKSISADVSASTALLRTVIEPQHLSNFGYEELQWLTRNVAKIIEVDPGFAIEIYQAAYSYEERSDDKTSLGNSAILPLSSNRRQDYQGAWYHLEKAMPRFFELDVEGATRAVAGALHGYVMRRFATRSAGQAAHQTFPLGASTATIFDDSSAIWFRGSFTPKLDAPAILSALEEFLDKLGNQADGASQLQRILSTLTSETVVAAIWSSLLIAGTKYPSQFAAHLVPLACAMPVMLSWDCRHQVGNFISAVYNTLTPDDRAVIEHAILALTGVPGEKTKAVLAGCIPSDLVFTDAMREYLRTLKETGASRPNTPPMQMTVSRAAFDTDAYLESEGVPLEAPASVTLRKLMHAVEQLPNESQSPEFSAQKAQARLRTLQALHRGVVRAVGRQAPKTLTEHAAGVLANAGGNLARAAPPILNSKSVRPALQKILLYCATSPNPHFDAKHERNFHVHLSWGGPSARTSAAHGLIDLVRADAKLDKGIRIAIHRLARDRVCHVRLQVITHLHFLRRIDLEWVWSEFENVAAQEPTRGVVLAAIESLGGVATLDPSRAIRIAKSVIKRYRGISPGMPECRAQAASLIFDIHIYDDSSEADKFASRFISELPRNGKTITNLVFRYSGNLLIGMVGATTPQEQRQRERTLSFYSSIVRLAFEEIEGLGQQFDIKQSASWPVDAQESLRSMFEILNEVSLRLNLAVIAPGQAPNSASEISPEQARLYDEARPLLKELSGAVAAPIAHHLIEALEQFIPLDPAGVFELIAQAVKSSQIGGYGIEHMAADLIVRIVERYLADYRSIFADRIRLEELMECLDVFVRAGWPAAQALTFRLGEIWR
jgi:hypothetical protein